MEALVGIGIGLLLVGIVLVTAPWWVMFIDPVMQRWLDWTVRQIERIEARRERGG